MRTRVRIASAGYSIYGVVRTPESKCDGQEVTLITTRVMKRRKCDTRSTRQVVYMSIGKGQPPTEAVISVTNSIHDQTKQGAVLIPACLWLCL